MKKYGGFSGLLVVGLVLFFAVTGGWQLALVIVVALSPFALWQVVSRRAATRRHAAHLLTGDGFWRVRVYDGRYAVLGDGHRWTGWLYAEFVPADVTSSAEGVTFTPARGARMIGGFGPGFVPWADVVSASARELGRTTPDGKLSFTVLTEVTIVLSGEFVPWVLRPDWEEVLRHEMAADGSPPDAEEWADAVEWTKELQSMALGEDGVLGTQPLRLTTDAPEGLVDLVGRRARSKPLS